MLHAPMPMVGVFAASVTSVWPQVAAPVWSSPAAAVVGPAVKVIVTSSVEAVQGAFDTVQRKV